MLDQPQTINFETFKDCVSTVVIQKLAPVDRKTSRKRATKGRKKEVNTVHVLSNGDSVGNNDASELGDFIEYLSEEIFSNLPSELRLLSFAAIQDDKRLAVRYTTPLDSKIFESIVTPLPLSVSDSLHSYSLTEDWIDFNRFLESLLTAYIDTVTSPPPEHTPSLTSARPDGCEICQREHLPLTYHHLIPRQVHAKAVKRGWHREWELNKVAWLCRACHSYVHEVASNEELARDYYDVELLMQRDDVQKWAVWVGRVRWKAR